MKNYTLNSGFDGIRGGKEVNAGSLFGDLQAKAAERQAAIETTALPSPTAISGQVLLDALKAGLNLSDLTVLWFMVDVAMMNGDDSVIKTSQYDIANGTGLNISAVKRSISKLTGLDYVVRKQGKKAQGIVATTLLSETAFELLGCSGGAQLNLLPLDMKGYLISESNDMITCVQRAWESLQELSDDECLLWRGVERDLCAVKSCLTERLLYAKAELLSAHESKQLLVAEEAKGLYMVEAHDGNVCVNKAKIDAVALYAHADIKFGVETLNMLSKRKPGLVTIKSAPALLSEILYSRTFGYVQKYDFAEAQTRLLRALESPAWSRPKSIRDYWYTATASGCKALSTTSPKSVH